MRLDTAKPQGGARGADERIIFSLVDEKRNLTITKSEKPMAEIGHSGPAGIGAARQDAAPEVAPTRNSAASPEKYCAYNQTRERFVATDVEAADALPAGAEGRLRALEQGAGIGLWILPYQEISPANIRFPVDLVFLNNDCVVLDLVESFPLASLPASSARAVSVLALPADTVAKGEMRAGDQLIICEPEEMKQRLKRLREAKAGAQSSQGPVLEHFAMTSAEQPIGRAIEEPVQGVVDSGPAAPVKNALTKAAPVKPDVAAGKVASTEELAVSKPIDPNSWKKRLGTRNWFTNLLLGDPADPRAATREALPGLIAYFFTGGTPTAHEVRDISTTGIYIITNERWYPGTVIRVTLTDRHHPKAERTLTVNAQAVRQGNDGVGLEFVLEKEDEQRIGITQTLEQTHGVNRARVEAFLQELKTPPSQE
jgi:hypothetical protein